MGSMRRAKSFSVKEAMGPRQEAHQSQKTIYLIRREIVLGTVPRAAEKAAERVRGSLGSQKIMKVDTQKEWKASLRIKHSK